MAGLTYDTGALLAAEKNDRAMWALHRRALERGVRPTVPATVLAQAWRGGPQPELSRCLAGCNVEPLTEERTRLAGAACARARTRDIVDASVVAGALARNDALLTSDMADLTTIARAFGRTLAMHRV